MATIDYSTTETIDMYMPSEFDEPKVIGSADITLFKTFNWKQQADTGRLQQDGRQM